MIFGTGPDAVLVSSGLLAGVLLFLGFALLALMMYGVARMVDGHPGGAIAAGVGSLGASALGGLGLYFLKVALS